MSNLVCHHTDSELGGLLGFMRGLKTALERGGLLRKLLMGMALSAQLSFTRQRAGLVGRAGGGGGLQDMEAFAPGGGSYLCFKAGLMAPSLSGLFGLPGNGSQTASRRSLGLLVRGDSGDMRRDLVLVLRGFFPRHASRARAGVLQLAVAPKRFSEFQSGGPCRSGSPGCCTKRGGWTESVHHAIP